MATLAGGERIDVQRVDDEIVRLRAAWRRDGGPDGSLVTRFLGPDARLDRFDRAQLEEVLRVCLESASLSAAGRELFAVSRAQRSSVNDADRLRKYLARHGLEWRALVDQG